MNELAYLYGQISNLYLIIEKTKNEEPDFWVLEPFALMESRDEKISACKRLINKIKFKVNELEAKHER